MEFDNNIFYGKDGCIYWKANLENVIRLYVKMMEKIQQQDVKDSTLEGKKIKRKGENKLCVDMIMARQTC